MLFKNLCTHIISCMRLLLPVRNQGNHKYQLVVKSYLPKIELIPGKKGFIRDAIISDFDTVMHDSSGRTIFVNGNNGSGYSFVPISTLNQDELKIYAKKNNLPLHELTEIWNFDGEYRKNPRK